MEHFFSTFLQTELKIRVIYFDRIRVDKVEGMVHDIYKYVLDLDDMKFLIRYAPKLFPGTSEEVTGEGIGALLVVCCLLLLFVVCCLLFVVCLLLLFSMLWMPLTHFFLSSSSFLLLSSFLLSFFPSIIFTH